MEDVAPGLLKAILADFLALLGEAAPAPGSYEAAGAYAQRVGAALAAAVQKNLSGDALPDGRMYWNIADRVVRPLLEKDHALCAGAAAAVQAALNKAAGIGLAVETPEPDAGRIDGILQGLAAAEKYEDAARLLSAPVLENFSRAAVDETLRRNVEAHARAGLHPRVIRTAEAGCCKWCSALAGTYNYPNVPQDVYRRHKNCRCTVEYDPATGRRRNVWTKRWTDGEESAILEKRKTVGIPPADSPKLAALKEKMTAQVQRLPAEMQEALRQYTGFTGTQINNAIRYGRVTEEIQHQIELLDSALNSGQMAERLVLYRRTASAFLGLPENPTQEQLYKIVDRAITNNIFTSTSFFDLKLPGRNTLIELVIPEGYIGCQYIRSVAFPKYKMQDEVLFARGLQYKITDIQFANGRYQIKAEVQG